MCIRDRGELDRMPEVKEVDVECCGQHEVCERDSLLAAVSKKIEEAVKKLGFFPQGSYRKLADKPSYDEAAALAKLLMELFLEKNIYRAVGTFCLAFGGTGRRIFSLSYSWNPCFPPVCRPFL